MSKLYAEIFIGTESVSHLDVMQRSQHYRYSYSYLSEGSKVEVLGGTKEKQGVVRVGLVTHYHPDFLHTDIVNISVLKAQSYKHLLAISLSLLTKP